MDPYLMNFRKYIYTINKTCREGGGNMCPGL
jgi:hypothetical protein